VGPRTDFVPRQWQLSFSRQQADTLLAKLSGSWKLQNHLPSADDIQKQIESRRPIRRIAFDTQGLTAWDTGLLTFLVKMNRLCHRAGIALEAQGLPSGVRRLLKLTATATPPQMKTISNNVPATLFLTRIGTSSLKLFKTAGEMLSFIGEAFLTFIKLCRGKARYRSSDLALTIQESGAQALPIVSLISLLIGLILAFVGAVQLEQFGAQIYVANLVGLGMIREMGAMMTAVIMAGRTGAAFAAQIGTMQVNQEIDALRTMGISPMEFLVLPRMLALMMMMPLLCLYSDLLGILGGAFVSWGMLDISLGQYFDQTRGAIELNDFLVGLIKSVVFGVLVAVSGCLRGMQCGNSSSAVGDAATSAVVTAIVFIIVWDAIFTVVFNIIDF
jgi:phospholipid/cholesterol/gamma-HCH transport system permease protein